MSLTREQALDCFASNDLIGIGMEADAVRLRLHPEGVVSYVLDSTIRYPDAQAGHMVLGQSTERKAVADDSIPDFERLYAHVRHSVEMGCTGLLMEGHIDPRISIDWFEASFSAIKQRFPQITAYSLSASEILAIAANAGMDLRDTLTRLRDAGLDSISGDGLPLFRAGVEAPSTSLQGGTEDWLNVHRTAHELGLCTTAAMMFGFGETMEQRFHLLQTLRQLQDRTGGFTSFVPSCFQPNNTELPGSGRDEATAVEYLKTLAVSRMVLDNIRNVQSSWSTEGLKVSQMGLRFGANDMGSVMLGSKSWANRMTEEELRRLIRDAGFKPVQRDTLYRTMFLS